LKLNRSNFTLSVKTSGHLPILKMPFAKKFRNSKYVYLMVYDLSSGFTRQLMSLLPLKDGKHDKLKTIWHTSIVTYGYEYFYGGGLIKIKPGDLIKYWHIKLVHCENIGVPRMEYKEFELALKKRSKIFSSRNYNLISWNCNHFTNICMRLLLGKNLSTQYLEQVHRILKYSPLARSAIQLYKILQSWNNKPLYQRLFQQGVSSEEDEIGELGSKIECGLKYSQENLSSSTENVMDGYGKRLKTVKTSKAGTKDDEKHAEDTICCTWIDVDEYSQIDSDINYYSGW